MISFEVKGDSKIVEQGIFLPDKLRLESHNVKISNLKVYINGKRSRKKIRITKDGWRFVRPLKMTSKDKLIYTWETQCI